VFTSKKPAAIQKALLPGISTAAALLASVSMASAEGYGFIKPNISQFGEPVELRIQKTDGNMKLRQDSISIPISYEAGYKGTYSNLRKIDLRVEHITKGNGEYHSLRRDLHLDGDKDKVWGTTTIVLTRAQIEPMEKLGKELCASYTGNQDKRIDTYIPLTMHVQYEDNRNLHWFTRGTTIPATIVCEPDRPTNPAKLLQVSLFASPAHCHKPVVLTARFVVTLPATYKFKLQRGDGESQDASVFPTQKDGPFFWQHWHKQYVFHASETRKYRIVSENFQPLTDWVTINVVCPISHNAPQPNGKAMPQRPNGVAVPQRNLPQPKGTPVSTQRLPVAPRVPQHIQNLRKR
jgi:hypothetical protein